MTDPKAQTKSEIVERSPTPPPTAASALAVTNAQEQATAMLQVLKEVALAPNVNVDAIRAIMEMQRQLTNDQAERALNEALARLAPRLPRIKRNGTVEYPVDKANPKGEKETAFKFARWEDIDKGIRPLLADEGLSLSYTTKPRIGDGGGTIIVGRVSHIQGAFKEAEFSASLDSSGGKNNIQAMKSSFRYGQRAVTEMLLNIVTEGEDDDGNTAEVIDIEQAVEIDTRLRKLGDAYRARFLKWLKVKEPTDINKRDYMKVTSELARVEAEAKKKGAL